MNKYKALQQFFRYLEDEEEISRHPMRRIPQPSTPKRLIPVLDTEELAAVLAACAGKSFLDRRDTAIIRLLLDTGGRLGEITVVDLDDLVKGADAHSRLRAEFPGAGVELRELDLSDLESVEKFAAGVFAEYPRLDVLVNNAGIMMPPRTLSRQGFEIQFATNHLGHFALTCRLLPALRHGTEARVAPLKYYGQSKFANVVFGLELDRLRTAGLAVRSILAHPGYAVTNLQTAGPTGLARLLFRLGNVLVAQDVTAGAQSQLRAATDPRIQGGQFLGPARFSETPRTPGHRPAGPRRRGSRARQPALGLSANLTGVSPDLPASG